MYRGIGWSRTSSICVIEAYFFPWREGETSDAHFENGKMRHVLKQKRAQNENAHQVNKMTRWDSRGVSVWVFRSYPRDKMNVSSKKFRWRFPVHLFCIEAQSAPSRPGDAAVILTYYASCPPTSIVRVCSFSKRKRRREDPMIRMNLRSQGYN